MITKICLSLIGASIITRAIIYIAYDKLLKMSYKPLETENELIRQMRLRYTNCNTLSIPIKNTEVFVRKHIISNSCLRGVVPFIDMAGYIMVLFAVGLMLYVTRKADATILSGAIMFLIADKMVNKEEKLKLTVSNITDYLDNTISHRNGEKRQRRDREVFEKISINAKMDIKADAKGKEPAETICVATGDKEAGSGNNKEKVIGSVINNAIDKENAEEIINEVLREYLV